MQEIDGPVIATATALVQILDLLGLRRRLLFRVAAGLLIGLVAHVWFADVRAPLSEAVVSAWETGSAAVLVVTSALALRKERKDALQAPPKEPSPARLALLVILLTGGAAVIMLVQQGAPRQLPDLAVPGAVLAGTLLIAWLAWRFASAHADEIGEVRFDTSQVREPGGEQA